MFRIDDVRERSLATPACAASRNLKPRVQEFKGADRELAILLEYSCDTLGLVVPPLFEKPARNIDRSLYPSGVGCAFSGISNTTASRERQRPESAAVRDGSVPRSAPIAAAPGSPGRRRLSLRERAAVGTIGNERAKASFRGATGGWGAPSAFSRPAFATGFIRWEGWARNPGSRLQQRFSTGLQTSTAMS